MPFTTIVEPTGQGKRAFSYDEMVMSSDGTRYYIKYLDANGKPTTTTSPKAAQQQQQLNAAQMQKQATTKIINGNKVTTVTVRKSTVTAAQQQQKQAAEPPRKQIRIDPKSIKIVNQTSTLQALPGSITVRKTAVPVTIAPASNTTNSNVLHCGQCNQKFANQLSLNFHTQRVHSDDVPVICPCGRKFANKKYMKQHQKRRFDTERIICGREKQGNGGVTTTIIPATQRPGPACTKR